MCLQWSSLLKLGSYVKVLFSVNMIVAINVLFILFDLIAIIMCAKESSLVDFFESFFFYIYIFGDALKNIFFSLLLAFYGIRLIIKFYRYSTIELNEKEDSHNLLQRQHSVFSTALSRLTITLIVASFCFVTRLIMLILKSIALNSEDTVTSSTFPLFGFYWFCFSDFIPRVLPSLTFVLLMRSKRRGIKRELDTSLHKGISNSRQSNRNSNRFTYLGDEEDYDEDESSNLEDYFSEDDDADSETESISLFDPPPGSFIDDHTYSSTPLVGRYKYSSNLGSGQNVNSNDRDESDAEEKPHASSASSGIRRLSDEAVSRERKRHELNAASSNEMSLTSFRTLTGSGDL